MSKFGYDIIYDKKYGKFRHILLDQPLKTEEYFLFIENEPSSFKPITFGSSFGELFDVTGGFPELKISNPLFKKPRSFFSEYQISGVNFPNRYSGLISINFQGRQIRVPGNSGLYDPLVCMINENGDCSGLQFFNNWCDEIQSVETGLSKMTKSLVSVFYTRQVYLILLNGNNKLSVFHFVNAFPLMIGSIEFNWGIQNPVVYPVHLNFDYLNYVGTYKKGVDIDYDNYFNLIGYGVD